MNYDNQLLSCKVQHLVRLPYLKKISIIKQELYISYLPLPDINHNITNKSDKGNTNDKTMMCHNKIAGF